MTPRLADSTKDSLKEELTNRGSHPGEDSLSCFLVDHLDDPDDSTADAYWHAENGPGGVARLLVDVGVESLVFVDLGHVESLASLGNVAGNTFANWEPAAH